MDGEEQVATAPGLRVDGDIDWRKLKAPFFMRQFYVVLYLAYISYAGGIAEGLLPLTWVLAGLLSYCLATARLFFKLQRQGLTPSITRMAMRQDLLMLGLGYIHDPYASGPTVVAGLVILLGNGLRHGPDYYKESAVLYIGIILLAAWLRESFTPGGYPVDAGAVALFTVISMGYGQFLVSRLWQSRQTLLRNSRQDDVTDLLTRRAFRSLAGEYLDTATAHGVEGTLLYLDLDNFKQVNDLFGHAEGDAALLAIADILRGHADEADLASRYGGDEFVMFARGLNLEGARHLAQRIEQEIRQLARRWPGSGLGVSIGLARAPEQARDIDTLLAQADLDMYRVKQNA